MALRQRHAPWTVVLLLAAGLGTGQAGAAPPARPTALTITGTSGFADLTLPVESSLVNDSFDRHVKITGGGEYAGFRLVPFDPTRRLRGFASAPCKASRGVGNRARTHPHLVSSFRHGAAGRTVPVVPVRGPSGAGDDAVAGTQALAGAGRCGNTARVHVSLTRSGPSPDLIRERQSTGYSSTGVAWVGWQLRGTSPVGGLFADNMCLVPAGELCAGPLTTADHSYSSTPSGAYGAGPETLSTSSGPDGYRHLRGPVDLFMTRAATDITTRLAFTLRVDFSPGPPAR